MAAAENTVVRNNSLETACEQEKVKSIPPARICDRARALMRLYPCRALPSTLWCLANARRVEYDQIVAVAYLFEILDGIGGDGLMSDGIAEVEFHVLVGELYGPLRRIDGAYLYGSSGHGPDREPLPYSRKC